VAVQSGSGFVTPRGIRRPWFRRSRRPGRQAGDRGSLGSQPSRPLPLGDSPSTSIARRTDVVRAMVAVLVLAVAVRRTARSFGPGSRVLRAM